jgi:alpha-L-rhamnosidase
LFINGGRVGDQVFTPGWTAYDHRLQYQTYDITAHLKPGKNAVGAILGDGWYRGYLGFGNTRNVYGERVALLAQIEVVYEDGTRDVFGTDKDWKAATGPILASDIYNGETYDARLEMAGWSQAGFDDADWKGVRTADHGYERLVAPAGPPIEKIEEIRPVEILETPKGRTVVDMGQNMVGWCRIRVQGPAGTRITLRHAEVLDKAGDFYTANLRAARQKDVYILKGGEVEAYEPRFTFHGFRYVAVEGWPGELSLEDITGVVVHSAVGSTGSFECSNPMLNQLQHNIRWGLKGNFLDVPTDCPQRDERLGWTGDAQAFARTAFFIADCAGFFTKWLADLAADQKPSGAVPHVIPNAINRRDPEGWAASAGWADAATIVPWTLYLSCGDTGILERQYASMKAWVDYMARKAGDSCFWHQDFTFGDWLAYNTNSSDYPGATTDKDLITQAFFAHSTDLLIRSARVLGRSADVAKYTSLLDKIRGVFVDEFVTPNGRLASNTQTAYSLALAFDLLPEALRAGAAERLARDVRRFEHITTGFLGTPLICHVLSDFGYWDEAFMLLNRTEYPSWLYPITKGATTIWERWDGIKPDGSFQDRGMNSFNHYAYGAIGEWLYRRVAGIEIDPSEPGYRHILIRPHPGGGLTYVKAGLESPYGPVACEWHIDGATMTVVTRIPPNTSATITLPGAETEETTVGGRALSDVKAIKVLRRDADTLEVKAGSGEHTFVYKISKDL